MTTITPFVQAIVLGAAGDPEATLGPSQRASVAAATDRPAGRRRRAPGIYCPACFDDHRSTCPELTATGVA